jgi:hypothetical protein
MNPAHGRSKTAHGGRGGRHLGWDSPEGCIYTLGDLPILVWLVLWTKKRHGWSRTALCCLVSSCTSHNACGACRGRDCHKVETREVLTEFYQLRGRAT